MKVLRACTATLIAICLLIVLFFTAMQLSIFNMDYIDREMTQLATAERLGMAEDDLHELFNETLKYLSDDRDDLVIPTVVHGEEREAYNEQEKLHMVDVKNLFTAGFRLRNGCLIALAPLIVLWIMLHFSDKKLHLSKAIAILWTVFLLLFTLMIVYLATHFDQGFIMFHKIFFHNDLWLMDPDTSLMINMVPEEFFFDMAMRIGLYFVIPFLCILIGSYIVWIISARRRRAEA